MPSGLPRKLDSSAYGANRNSTARREVLDLYFGERGLGFSLGRVHMNSCDFSMGHWVGTVSQPLATYLVFWQWERVLSRGFLRQLLCHLSRRERFWMGLPGGFQDDLRSRQIPPSGMPGSCPPLPPHVLLLISRPSTFGKKGNYSFDDVPEDHDLLHFDRGVTRDSKAVIPMILSSNHRAAKKPMKEAESH